MKKLFFNNKEINKQLIITTFSIILTVTLVISTSLAAFTWNDSSEETNKISSGAIGVSISNTSGSLSMENAYPTTTLDALAGSDMYTFTVSNTTSNPVYYSIKLVSDEEAISTDGCADNQIDEQYIDWNIDGEGDVYNIAYNNDIVSEGYLANGDSKTMSIRLWINTDAPNDIIGSHFHGKLVLEYKQAESYVKLSDKIIENNPVNETTPDFSTVATTDEGLFKANDADGETYYFRGAVEDNYVSFANMLWRIVRINGDGTIRLIANETVGTSKFNENFGNEKYVGYTYDNSSSTLRDGTNSTIKTFLDNWYTTNLNDYNDMIVTTKYCNDTSTASTSETQMFYGAYGRLYANKTPTFVCPNTDKTYGGEYNLKIGLLSADENAFAGNNAETNNTNYFLNMRTLYFTGSPYNKSTNNEYIISVSSDGKTYGYSTISGYVNVIPVINLKGSTPYSTGTGTSTDPYIVGSGE